MLADDFWRIAHDEHSGRPRIHEQATALGLAAALIAELLVSGNITTFQGGLVVLDASPPECPVAHLALTEIRAEQPHAHPLQTWLRFFATDSHKRVADRMVRAGHLLPETRRARLVGRPVTTYVPKNPVEAARPIGVLSTNLRNVWHLDGHLAVLAGLGWATGLGAVLLDGAPDVAGQYLDRIVRGLWNPAAVLALETREVVNSAVMSGL